MARGNTLILPLALVCVLSASCARLASPPSSTDARSSSPLTSTIALSVSGWGVYLVDPVTGLRRSVQRGMSDFQAGWAAWAPDHRRLAYGNGGILVEHAGTGRKVPLVPGPSLSMPAWSRHGRQLVYGDGLHMWVTAVAKPRPEPVRLPPWLAPVGMSWNPSRAIAFSGLRLDCSQAVGCSSTERSEIWTVRPDGTRLRKLTSVGHAEKPKWSRDGSRILFVATDLEAKRRSTEVWTVGVDGSEASRLLGARNVVAADWSPDGTQLALVRRQGDSERLQLWIGASDGSGLSKLGDPIPGIEATLDW